MASCLICLERIGAGSDYHPACLKALFGTGQLPALDLDLASLPSIAAKMAEKLSISGVQAKVSLTLSNDKRRIDVASSGGRYILKPETSWFAGVPPNEHVTMLLANLVGIELPGFGLIRLKDRSIAYIVKRFDRLDDGTKLRVEDFCQLAGEPRDKYEGSTGLCIRLLRRYATEPLVEVQKLFRLLLFSWWTANGDMHLKNFSVITTADGFTQLSPAYDLVCTRLVLADDDKLALPVGGRNKNLTRRTWLKLADYCRLPGPAAQRLLRAQIDALDQALSLINRSVLTQEAKDQYEQILRENTSILAG